MILSLNGIYKNYLTGSLEVPVLKDINLSVEEGEYLAIMGPSGSGKSTLMNIIGCLDKPTSGQYLFDGVDIARQNDASLSNIRNRGIGFVFQNFNLLPRQTALENVELPLLYANIRKKKRREIAAEALAKVGLSDRMNFLPTQLSGGQKQRVAIARAIANKPKILLADEPTGALDSKSGDQVMELFSQLNSEGMTIVMITHEKAIADCANKTIVIYDGELRTIEEFEKILHTRRSSRGDEHNG
ncbi:MAG: ABC transporter ATP-binding protein [Acutalibacteraceae bacterium]|nr:ABC transporter ATP-binding protein [Clostridia bacterium]MEE3449504.1 ABC transporter ATP-binding protein [Acutalibacteraceae bacterium]